MELHAPFLAIHRKKLGPGFQFIFEYDKKKDISFLQNNSIF